MSTRGPLGRDFGEDVPAAQRAALPCRPAHSLSPLPGSIVAKMGQPDSSSPPAPPSSASSSSGGYSDARTRAARRGGSCACLAPATWWLTLQLLAAHGEGLATHGKAALRNPVSLPMAQAQRAAVAAPARAACLSAAHVKLEIDPELRAHLLRWYTEADLNTILSAIVRPPPAVTLRVNTTQITREALVRPSSCTECTGDRWQPR